MLMYKTIPNQETYLKIFLVSSKPNIQNNCFRSIKCFKESFSFYGKKQIPKGNAEYWTLNPP